jgi:hypothetical protein
MFQIFSSISKVKDFWTNHGFGIIFVICIGFILVFAFLNLILKRKGTADKFALSLLNNNNNNDLTQYYQDQDPTPYTYNPPIQQQQVYFSNDEGDSAGERECRKVLQELFNQPFNRARPNFLRNPINKRFNLELDCYNENYKLAIEYNGAQHYKYIPHFHKNREAFLNQKYRDDIKKRLCGENGVILIEVPHTVAIKDIKSFLMKKLKEI